MDFPRTSALGVNLIWLDQVGSTNTDLVARVAQDRDLPNFSVVATDNQVSGKGRLGRVWSAPPGASLAVSVLLKPETPSRRPLKPESLGWMGLLAGLAMSRACNAVLPQGVVAGVKWPNDVVIEGKKVSGILSELTQGPTGYAVVVGAGVNIGLSEDQLPVPTATSLSLHSSSAQRDEILATYLEEFRRIVNVFIAAEGDVLSSGLHQEILEACDTIGRSVRVELPNGDKPVGTAVTIDTTGSLVVDIGEGFAPLVVAVGDVTHLRVLMKDAQSE